MADKELRRMNRAELIEIIYVLQQNEHALRAENEELKKQLDDRMLRLKKAGSIAEAALSVNHIFEDAQNAAGQYLDNLRSASDSATKILEEAQQKADAILSAAQEHARQTEEECRVRKEEAESDLKRCQEAFVRDVRIMLEKYPEFASYFQKTSGR